MTRIVLTDKMLRAARPGDKRYDLLDAIVPGLLAVVHPSGHITLQLRTRLGAKHPVRRAIGQHGRVSVEAARRTAREWLELLHTGGSPEAARAVARAEEKRAHEAAAARDASTVAVVAGEFFARVLPKQRRGRRVERIVRSEVLPAWGSRPPSSFITDDQRAAIVAAMEEAHDAVEVPTAA